MSAADFLSQGNFTASKRLRGGAAGSGKALTAVEIPRMDGQCTAALDADGACIDAVTDCVPAAARHQQKQERQQEQTMFHVDSSVSDTGSGG